MASNDTRQCYFPDHNIAVDNVPCSSDEHTSCCGTSDICLSNGFCLNVNHQPWTMSRGACTNQAWDSGCPDRCISDNDSPSGGCSIINLAYENDVATYCCGTPVSDGSGNVICPNNEEPFTISDSHALPGYGLLSNISNFYVSGSAPATSNGSSNTTSMSPGKVEAETCHETAIGAGVGIPLGILALTALGWALFERRRNARATAAYTQMPAPSPAPPGYGGHPYGYDGQGGKIHPLPVELEQQRPVAEMMGPER